MHRLISRLPRLLDSFDMALICHILYWYLINNYGNVLSLSNPVWCVCVLRCEGDDPNLHILFRSIIVSREHLSR